MKGQFIWCLQEPGPRLKYIQQVGRPDWQINTSHGFMAPQGSTTFGLV